MQVAWFYFDDQLVESLLTTALNMKHAAQTLIDEGYLRNLQFYIFPAQDLQGNVIILGFMNQGVGWRFSLNYQVVDVQEGHLLSVPTPFILRIMIAAVLKRRHYPTFLALHGMFEALLRIIFIKHICIAFLCPDSICNTQMH